MSHLATQATILAALPAGFTEGAALALIALARANLLRRVEGPIRAIVNGMLLGRDPYEVLRLALAVSLFARAVRRLRDMSLEGGIYRAAMAAMMPLLKRLPMVKKELEKAKSQVEKDVTPSIVKDLTDPRRALPREGMSEGALQALMERRHLLDTKYWEEGKVTGSIYHGEKGHTEFIGRIYGMFAFFNPLHAGIHPSLRQMDAEVIQMVLHMYGGDESCCGAFTTGGTESILMAMKAYRDWGRAVKGITQPNIVAGITAHAAFDKAAQYFGIQLRHARTHAATQEVDVSHVASLVDGNTVVIVGSSPQYAHGTVDPIEELAALALSRGVGMHVDCCLGGFLVPFMKKARALSRPDPSALPSRLPRRMRAAAPAARQASSRRLSSYGRRPSYCPPTCHII
jgi:sphinganine-1-phosphate aldolase